MKTDHINQINRKGLFCRKYTEKDILKVFLGKKKYKGNGKRETKIDLYILGFESSETTRQTRKL